MEIVAPEGPAYRAWRVATTLPSAGAAPWGFGAYRAANYDELIDHPVEMADFLVASFEAGGATHDVAITGKVNVDLDRLTTDLARICQWQVDLFGGARGCRAPFDRYLFQVAAVGDGYGGLEHRSSTSLCCKRDELPAPGMEGVTDDYRSFLGLASHEYFHSWNVKRIKPAAFVPYDLARESYTRQLWAFEGITSYYDDLALVRCGVIDAGSYLELLGQTITGVLRTPGRHVQSVADSSFDAWIKFYRRDENAPNAVVSYYAKGALVALALDLTLRDAGASLDDLMRLLWQRHGAGGSRRARGRRRGDRDPSSPAWTSRISSRATCMAPRIRRLQRCSADSASRSTCGPPTGMRIAAASRAADGRRRTARGLDRGKPRWRRGSQRCSTCSRAGRPSARDSRPATSSSPSTASARRSARSRSCCGGGAWARR